MKSVKPCGKASVMLTPKEIAYIVLALEFAEEMKDVDAEEEVHSLMAKLGSRLAVAILNQE
jgi:predicted DNA-binding transcriptional regulator YafY